MISFTGAAKRRSSGAIPRAAALLNVEPAALAAVIEVETSGAGFDRQSRPKALFEPHRFYAALASDSVKLAKAIKAGLAYRRQGEKPYPADSYPRITAAVAIDETAALASTSWGLPQILGSNFEAAGYVTPQALLTAFLDSEDEQIAAMARFILAEDLDEALRDKDWASFAAGYNGQNYAKGGYQLKLAATYKKQYKVTFAAVEDIDPEAEAIETLQTMLAAKHYAPGAADGKFGTLTRGALLAFKADYNEANPDTPLPLDDSYGDDVLADLVKWPGRPLDPQRQAATATDLAPTSTIVKATGRSKIMAWIVGAPALVVAAVNGAVHNFGNAADMLKPVQAFVSDIPGWGWGLGAAAVAVGIWSQSDKAQQARVDMHRDGSAT